MSTMLQDVPEVGAAYEEFKRFTADPVVRKKAIARQRFLDEQSIIMNDMWKEGIAEGETRKARENAYNMKQRGYPVFEMSEITGLPLSEIEQLN